MNVLEQLTAKKDFTDTEKRLAEYILAHQEEMAEMNISDLAKKAYSSHSAVVRLAKKLGFAGYREFKIALAKAFQESRHITSQVDPNFPFRPSDNAAKIAKQVADLCIESIRKTFSGLDNQVLDQVAQLLLSSQRVFLFGTGDSQIRARSFQNKFNKINRYLIVADEYGESEWSAMNVTQADLAIFISYSGESRSYRKFIQYLNRKKIKTVLLTSNRESTLAQFSQLCIEVPAGELENVKVGTFASQISFEYVLDTLFSVMYSKDYTTHLVDLKNKERVLDENFFEDQLD